MDQALLFMNFSIDFDSYKSKYEQVAAEYKSKGISFLLGDLDASQGALQVIWSVFLIFF